VEHLAALAAAGGGVAVITGSASGLGYATARQCAALGLDVALTDVRGDALAAAAARLAAEFPSVRVLPVECDVTSRASVDAVAAAVDRELGRPVVYLGANAGVLFPRATVLSGSEDEWLLTLRVNVVGAVNTLQAFVPGMVGHGQRCVVVVTASMAGLFPGVSGPYGASKHATVAVVEDLHTELQQLEGGDRVSLHVLCPSRVDTPMHEAIVAAGGGLVTNTPVMTTDTMVRTSELRIVPTLHFFHTLFINIDVILLCSHFWCVQAALVYAYR
jgi:NAD(P)-dependent dehydrogenase (short-subunit alcohol dehydrogenase family)